MMLKRQIFLAMLLTAAASSAAVGQADKLATCEVPERFLYSNNTLLWGEYKNGLVRDVYDLQRAETILSSGVCSCENMFPVWDDAVAKTDERFRDAPEKGPAPDWVSSLRQDAANKMLKAVRFCKSEGAY